MGTTALDRKKIVKFIAERLECNESISAKEMHTLLCKHAASLQIRGEISSMSEKNFGHYIDTAKMFCKANEYRQKVDTETLSDADYEKLLSTGTYLCQVAGNLCRLSGERLLLVLKKIAENIPRWDRDDIKCFVDREIGEVESEEYEPSRFDSHHTIRDKVAKRYLFDMGCRFVTTEAMLERKYKGRRGLILDAYGWKEDGTICGIEVKTTVTDYTSTQKVARLDRYARYCNELYILVTDRQSYEDLKEWKMQLGYTEIGILLCDKDKYKIIDSEKPLEIRKEVTKTMLERMLKVLSVKCKSITKSVAFNRYDTNPKKAFEKLNLGFSQSFADCRTNQADINIDN